MKLLAILLFVAGVTCSGDTGENNKWLDKVMEKANLAVRKVGRTTLHIKSGQINKNVSYSKGTILGLDSFYRTGDNTNSYNGTHFLGDLHYGFRFLSAEFKNITIDGKDMSASFRIKNNSIHFAFYLIRIYGCKVSLHTLRLEELSSVDFGSSRQEYDESDVDEFFKTEVMSSINAYLDSLKDEIEKNLQFLCHPHQKDHFTEPPYLAFLEQVFYSHDDEI